MKRRTLHILAVVATAALCITLYTIASPIFIHQGPNQFSSERVTILIALSLDVNYSEVSAINYSFAKSQLLNVTLILHNRSEITNPDADLIYTVEDPKNKDVWIEIYSNESEQKAWISTFDTSPTPESDLEFEKSYMKNITEITANACNISLDWSKVVWSVSYAD